MTFEVNEAKIAMAVIATIPWPVLAVFYEALSIPLCGGRPRPLWPWFFGYWFVAAVIVLLLLALIDELALAGNVGTVVSGMNIFIYLFYPGLCRHGDEYERRVAVTRPPPSEEERSIWEFITFLTIFVSTVLVIICAPCWIGLRWILSIDFFLWPVVVIALFVVLIVTPYIVLDKAQEAAHKVDS
jgi:hypothetical protein